MKLKISLSAAIVIVTAFLITFFSLNYDQKTFVSLLLFCLVAGGILYLFITRDFSLVFGILIFMNHIAFEPGAQLARFSLTGIIGLILLMLFFVKKPQNPKTFYLSVGMFIFYYLIILIVRPFSLNLPWIFLHFESFLLFVIAQLVVWDKSKIYRLITFNLFLLVIFGIIERQISSIDRITGPMRSATAYGVMLSILWSTWVSISCFSFKQNWGKISIITVLSVIVMIWTGTRMAIIGVFLTPFLILIIRIIIFNNYSVFTKIFVLSGSSVFLIVTLFLLWNVLPDDLIIKSNFESLQKGEVDLSNVGRIIAWNVAIKAFQGNPIFGIGNGNFKEYITSYFEQYDFISDFMGLVSLDHAHNLFLIILSENGLFGFLSLTTVIFLAVYSLLLHIRNNSDSKCLFGLFIGLIIMLVLGLFDAVPYFPPTEAWGVWIIAVLLQLPRTVSVKSIKPSEIRSLQKGE